MASPPLRQQKLPAGLAGVLNKSNENRDTDSAYDSARTSARGSMLEMFRIADARSLLTTM